MDRPDLLDDPRFATLADRAAHGDEINGIVAEWTRARSRRRDRGARASHCDVPVATAYTAADIFADPHFAARGDLVDGRRPGGRPDAPAGAVPALRRRAAPRARPARRASASTPTRCSATCSASSADELDALRRRRGDLMPASPGARGPVHADEPRLLGGRCCRVRAASLPGRLDLPVLRRRRRRPTSSSPTTGTLWGVDRRDRAAARLPRRRAVRVRRRRAPRGPAGDHPARGGRPGAAVVRHADAPRARRHCTRTTTAPRSSTYAFAPAGGRDDEPSRSRASASIPSAGSRTGPSPSMGVHRGPRRAAPKPATRSSRPRSAAPPTPASPPGTRCSARSGCTGVPIVDVEAGCASGGAALMLAGGRHPGRPVRLVPRVRHREDAQGHHPLVVLRAVARGGRASRRRRRTSRCAPSG